MLLLQAFEPAPLPVNIVYVGGGLLPLKVRAFLDFSHSAGEGAAEGDLA